jgi:AraC family transcriptional regulator
MKPSQRVRYAERIEKVVEYLSTAMTGGEFPGLPRLAQVAGLSQYHFHRVFRLMTGETPAGMVKRLRLAAGAGALATDAPVMEAAGRAGYATSQAFARAFRSDVGASATGARAAGSLADIQDQLRKPQLERARAVAPPITVEVISLEPFTVSALRNVGDYAELNRGYARLQSLLPDLSAISGLYGIPYDDPFTMPATECRFDCCMSLRPGAAPNHSDVRSVTIAGGPYARAIQLGPYEQCWSTLDRLYGAIIDDLDGEIGEGPPFIHYHADPDTVPPAELRADLYVPLSQLPR